MGGSILKSNEESYLENWFEKRSAKYKSGVVVGQGVAESRDMAVAQPARVVHLELMFFGRGAITAGTGIATPASRLATEP